MKPRNDGTISAASGYELAKVGDPKTQIELASKVASGELTRDALAGLVKSRRQTRTAGDSKTPSRATARLSGGRSVTLFGGELTLESVIQTLKELSSRLRAEQSRGRTLATVLRMLAEESRVAAGKGGASC